MGASTGRMNSDEVRSFAHYICNFNVGKESGIRKINSIPETEGKATPIGTYPDHWVDDWHELEGGNDNYGIRPQYGVTQLQAEMNGFRINRDTKQPGTM